EFGIELPTQDARNDARGFDEERLVAVEVGAVLVVVNLEALAGPARPLDVLPEPKRPPAPYFRFRLARGLLELGRGVDAVEGRGQRFDDARHRVLQLEDDGRGIGGLDHQVLVIRLADRDDALRWIDDAVKARLDVGGAERRAVVKRDAAADLEGGGHPVW